MRPERLNALTDGVVAIVLTIMVLELKFPEEPTLEAVLTVFRCSRPISSRSFTSQSTVTIITTSCRPRTR